MHSGIEAWMFRTPGEYRALVITLVLLIALGIFFSLLNVYWLVALVLLGIVYVRLLQGKYMGNAVRVHEGQFPHLYETFTRYAQALGIRRASLYIIQDPTLNAFTIGLTSCSVVLTSALVQQLSMDELRFVIGHELGHYKAGHTKITTFISPLGAGNVFSVYLFGFWQRKTEYTADRCGLILSKDIDSAVKTMLKLALGGYLFDQFNMQGYVAQLKAAKSASVKLSEVLVDHPLITNRVTRLVRFWRDSFKGTHEMSYVPSS